MNNVPYKPLIKVNLKPNHNTLPARIPVPGKVKVKSCEGYDIGLGVEGVGVGCPISQSICKLIPLLRTPTPAYSTPVPGNVRLGYLSVGVLCVDYKGCVYPLPGSVISATPITTRKSALLKTPAVARRMGLPLQVVGSDSSDSRKNIEIATNRCLENMQKNISVLRANIPESRRWN